jgi:hypothetical protein
MSDFADHNRLRHLRADRYILVPDMVMRNAKPWHRPLAHNGIFGRRPGKSRHATPPDSAAEVFEIPPSVQTVPCPRLWE